MNNYIYISKNNKCSVCKVDLGYYALYDDPKCNKCQVKEITDNLIKIVENGFKYN